MEYYGILEFDGFRKFNHEDWVFQQQTYNIQHPVKLFHTERWKLLVYWATNLGCSYRSSQETPLGCLIYHRQSKIDIEFPCVSSIADFTWRNVDISSLKMWYPRNFMRACRNSLFSDNSHNGDFFRNNRWID
jgi:hypothetical protein